MAFLSGPPIDIAKALELRWWDRVDIGTDVECWPWLQSTGSHGYGQSWDGVTVRLAHRMAWTLHHGEQVPNGMTVDHICRNRVCCNPGHLRLMTNVENARRNGASQRTHCPTGHPYDDENTYRDPQGHRTCRTCAKERRRVA